MYKEKFKSEAEANAYKEKHKLYGRVAEPLAGGTKWGLVYPIKCQLEVRDGRPDQGAATAHK